MATALVVAAKLIVLASLAAAARSDIIHRIIPNRLVVIVAGSSILIRAVETRIQPFWESIVAAIAVFAVLRSLAGLGLLGGGDVKLISALVLGEPISAVMPLLAGTALAGGLLACGYGAAKWSGQWQWRRVSAGAEEREPLLPDDQRGTAEPLSRIGIPYGVAILFGALLVEFWRV